MADAGSVNIDPQLSIRLPPQNLPAQPPQPAQPRQDSALPDNLDNDIASDGDGNEAEREPGKRGKKLNLFKCNQCRDARKKVGVRSLLSHSQILIHTNCNPNAVPSRRSQMARREM